MPPTKLPEVSHRLQFADREITYQLRRSPRKTIGLSIDHRGLRIGAPTRAHLGDIETLIRQHAAWVIEKLDNWPAKQPDEALEVEAGTPISLLGQALTVDIDPLRLRGHHIDWPAGRLVLNRRQAPTQALIAALKHEARQVFQARLAIYARELGVPTPPLRLSSARTRWGSCNHRGNIALNWRLIFMPLPVIDYVVAHELAHLREMNHSAKFWSVVGELCPAWREHRQTLKALAKTIPNLREKP
jgi:predicted metal-dependent hydrolase